MNMTGYLEKIIQKLQGTIQAISGTEKEQMVEAISYKSM